MATLQLEMIRCGNCLRCLAGGKVHGPYWYSYRSVPAKNARHQKTVSEYIGAYKSGGADDIDPTPETQRQVDQMRQMSAKCADLLVALLTPEEHAAADAIVEADISARLSMRAAKKADTDAEREEHEVESKRLKAAVKDPKHWLKARRGSDGRVQPATFAAMKSALPKFQRRVKEAKKAGRTGS